MATIASSSRLERLAADRLQAVEVYRAGIGRHLSALGTEPLPVAPFIPDTAHAGMVVAQAKRTEKVRARDDDLAALLRDAHQLGEERLRFLDVLKDVQRADAVEGGIAEPAVCARRKVDSGR